MMKQSIMPIDEQPRFGKFLPGQHKPLMAIIEITDRCNLSCPVCFANSNHSGQDISVDKVRTYRRAITGDNGNSDSNSNLKADSKLPNYTTTLA